MKALFTKIGVTVPAATGPVLDSANVSYLFPQGFSRWEFGPDASSLESINGAGVFTVHNASYPPAYGPHYLETHDGGGFGLRSPFEDSENFVDIFAFVYAGALTTIGGAPNPSDTTVGDVIVLGNTTTALRWIMRSSDGTSNMTISLTGIEPGQCLVFAAKMLGGARSIYIPGAGWATSAAAAHDVAEGRYRSIGNTGYAQSGYTTTARFVEFAHQDGVVVNNDVAAAVSSMISRVQDKGFTVYGA